MAQNSFSIQKRPNVYNKFLYLKGSYKNYKVEITEDLLKVEDLNYNPPKHYEYSGLKDKSITHFGFDDLRKVSVIEKIPYHVPDIVDLQPNKPLLIQTETLLQNDKDFRNSKLSVLSVKNAIGCKVKLVEKNLIMAVPDPSFSGIKSFSYTIQNELGFKNVNSINVYIREPHHPNDPDFFEQWYLSEINILPVWKDYSGRGVNVAVLDEGYIPNNPDLEIHNGTYEISYDGSPLGQHASMVASVIGAKHNNSLGMTGIAYNTNITSVQIPLGYISKTDSTDHYHIFPNFDVINNSFGPSFNRFCIERNVTYRLISSESNSREVLNEISRIEEAVTKGRDGKGSIIVFAGGNEHFADANFDLAKINPYNIIVGGHSKPTWLLNTFESLFPHFASSSSLTLVGAPATHFMVAENRDLTITDDTISSTPDNIKVGGTSFSAPTVTSVVALMLEANPNLGWRDVQDILAYSALPESEKHYLTNAAKNSNAGGLVYCPELGFGLLDSFGAVRLAETWESSNTMSNYANYATSPKTYRGIVSYGQFKQVFKVEENIEIEFIKIHYSAAFDLSNLPPVDLNSILSIDLISPNNRTYTIIENIGYSKILKKACIDFGNVIDWDFGFQHARGDKSKGEWQLTTTLSFNPNIFPKIDPAMLQVLQAQISDKGRIIPLEMGLNFYGKPINFFSKDIIFTKVLKELVAQTERLKIGDDHQSFHTINTVAVPEAVQIDLSGESKTIINSIELTFSKNHSILNIKSGDGDDLLIGDKRANIIMPGRGNDKIITGDGEDIVWYPNLNWKNLGHDIIHDFDIRKDKLKFHGVNYDFIKSIISENYECSDNKCRKDSVISQDDWSITLAGISNSEINETHFIFG